MHDNIKNALSTMSLDFIEEGETIIIKKTIVNGKNHYEIVSPERKPEVKNKKVEVE